MRGGGRIDVAETAAREFQDRRSYVRRTDGAEFLFGEDMKIRRFAVWKRDGKRCVYCCDLVTLDSFELDHKVSRGRGGSDNIENLQTTCSPCHKLKTAQSEHH